MLPLGSRALDILIYLAERPGELIAKQELLDRVWSDVTVEEGSIRVHVFAIRKALGDGQFGNRYIANIRGRGYSFVGTVVPLAGSAESRNRRRQEVAGSRLRACASRYEKPGTPIVQPSSTSIRIRLRAHESAPQKSTSRRLGSRPFKNYLSNCGIVPIGLTVDARAAGHPHRRCPFAVRLATSDQRATTCGSTVCRFERMIER